MAKYSYEFKKRLVDEYIEGSGGYITIAEKYNVRHSQVELWVAKYRAYGDVGLISSKQHKSYTYEFKKHAVELYLSSELSYADLALQLEIASPSALVNWVKSFRTGGLDALRPRKKGRPSKMPNNSKKTQKKPTPSNKVVNFENEKIKQLEEENYNLRLENAVLKKFGRLSSERAKKNF